MARVNIDKLKFEAMLDNPECTRNTNEVGTEIAGLAKGIYLGDRVLPSHNDYVSSFVVEMEGRSALVGNTDDTSFWVEFGAHAGGVTPVLGYAPLRRAVDAAASANKFA